MRTRARLVAFSLLVSGAVSLSPTHPVAQSREQVVLASEGDLGDPGNFGAEELATALRQRGLEVLRTSDFGKADGAAILLAGIARRSVRLHDLEYSGRISVPPSPESYAIRHVIIDGKPIVAVAGSDERGVMYALLEITRRIARVPDRVTGVSPAGPALAEALARLPEEIGKPEVQVRGVLSRWRCSNRPTRRSH